MSCPNSHTAHTRMDGGFSEERIAVEVAAIVMMLIFGAVLYKVCHISAEPSTPNLEEGLRTGEHRVREEGLDARQETRDDHRVVTEG